MVMTLSKLFYSTLAYAGGGTRHSHNEGENFATIIGVLVALVVIGVVLNFALKKKK